MGEPGECNNLKQPLTNITVIGSIEEFLFQILFSIFKKHLKKYINYFARSIYLSILYSHHDKTTLNGIQTN